MDPLADFQADLDRLAELDDDALSALEQGITAAFDAADTASDDTAMGQLADALDQVKAEKAKRADGGDAASAPPVPAAAEPAVAAAADAPDSDTPAPATEQETPAVTASTVQVIEPDPQVPEGREPVAEATRTSTIIASAGLKGLTMGAEVTDAQKFAQAMATRIQQITSTGGGDGEQVLVASIKTDIPDDRFLKYGDPLGNRAKIDEINHLDAITAAGGCCSPLTTRYDLFTQGETSRPVKGALTGFGADRGGIRFYEGPTLSSVGAAVGFWTCADDAAVDAADPDTWKVCARVECPDESEALVQAVTLCLTFGVMQSRVFPEMVTANNELARVAQARLSESAILAQIKAGSKKVTAGGNLPTGMSFLRSLMDTISRAAAYYRDRHRLTPTAPLRAIFPVWMLEALRSDTTLQIPSTAQLADNYGLSVDELESFFRDRNINVTWTMDSTAPATNGGGFYANVADGGALPNWPSTVEFSLYTEGTWLFLDGGQLDLGIVRDSTLVRTNDYQTFMETFESAVRTGGESLWVTQPVAVTGRYAGAVTYA